MLYEITSGTPDKHRIACVAVPVFKGNRLSASAHQLDRASGGAIYAGVKQSGCTGVGKIHVLTNVQGLHCSTVMLVGMGSELEVTLETYTDSCKALLEKLNSMGFEKVLSYLHTAKIKKTDLCWRVRQGIVCIETSLNENLLFKNKKKNKTSLRKWVFGVSKRSLKNSVEHSIIEGKAIGSAINATAPIEVAPDNKIPYVSEMASTYENELVEFIPRDALPLVESGITSFSVFNDRSDIAVLSYNGGAKTEKPLCIVCADTVVGIACIDIAVSMQMPVNITVVLLHTDFNDSVMRHDIVYLRAGISVRVFNAYDRKLALLADALSFTNLYRPNKIITVLGSGWSLDNCLGKDHAVLWYNNASVKIKVRDVLNEIKTFFWVLPINKDVRRTNIDSVADLILDTDNTDSKILYELSVMQNFIGNKQWLSMSIGSMRDGGVPVETFKDVPRFLAQYLLNLTV